MYNLIINHYVHGGSSYVRLDLEGQNMKTNKFQQSRRFGCQRLMFVVCNLIFVVFTSFSGPVNARDTPAFQGVGQQVTEASESLSKYALPVDSAALKKWQDMRFGMFIHWGLYSKTAGYWKGRRAKSSGHIMLYERISVKEWGELAADFNPVKFDANEWVSAIRNAGCKYLVITAKHHDGLAMYDSPSSDYDLVDKSPFKRDPLKELADACHEQGIALGIYYSLGRDWEDPDVPTNFPTKGGRSNTWDYPDEDAKVFHRYFLRKAKPQIEELVTRYGKVDILWFDTHGLISRKESEELRDLIRSHQPECIINSRIGHGLGDFLVREQFIGDSERNPWESCVTMARHWTYDRDEAQQYKSAELLVHQLLEIVSKGGNYLLNIGPRADGTITEEALVRMKAIGEWLEINGEGIYGSRPWRIDHEALAISPERRTGDPIRGQEGKDAVNDATSRIIPSEIRFTSKGGNIYAFICRWDRDRVRIASLAAGKERIKDVKILGFEGKVRWEQSVQGLDIELPVRKATVEVPFSCVRIELGGEKLSGETKK